MSDLIRLDDAIEAFLPAGGIHWVHRSKREIVTILRTLPAVTVQAQIDAAVAAERERCVRAAVLAGERSAGMSSSYVVDAIAAAIRKGDQP